MITNANRQELIRRAVEVRDRAYAPYSNFKVGAALLTVDGEVFTGCNVENASFGLCLCAERTALAKAVSEGFLQFQAIAVAATPLASPCGACRQFLLEFGTEIEVISVNAENLSEMKSWTSGQLVPDGFRLKSTVKTK